MEFGLVEKEALELTLQERAKLAQRLLESLDEVSVQEAEELWLDVASARAAEIDSGSVKLVSAEELEDRVQAILK